jgi:hypothetical protein
MQSPARGESLRSPWREPRETIAQKTRKPRQGRHSVDKRLIRARDSLDNTLVSPPEGGFYFFLVIATYPTACAVGCAGVARFRGLHARQLNAKPSQGRYPE